MHDAPGRRNIIRNTITRNAIANAAGVVLPAVVAIAATPLLIHALGTARYGILSLQLAALVLLGVNDFGISRAIVLVAVGRGGFGAADIRQATTEAGLHLSISLALVMALVGVGAILTAFIFVGDQNDLLISSLLTVISAALSLVTLPLRANMEVEERFFILNIWRTIATSLLFVAPLAAILVVPSLTSAAIGLLISRLVVLSGFMFVSRQRPLAQIASSYMTFIEELWRRRLSDIHMTLIRRGAWLGLGGLLSTFIGYSDRFVLASLASATAVGHYVVASELTTKLWLIVGALSIAATPRLAAAWKDDGHSQFNRFFAGFAGAIATIALASHIFLIVLGEKLLQLWLGTAYAPIIYEIVKILSIGISLNCLAQANYILLVIGRRERSGAILQLVSLPITILALSIGAWKAGAVGAAWAFTIRLAIDAFVVRWIVNHQIDLGGRHGVRAWLLALFGLVLIAIYFADGLRR